MKKKLFAISIFLIVLFAPQISAKTVLAKAPKIIEQGEYDLLKSNVIKLTFKYYGDGLDAVRIYRKDSKNAPYKVVKEKGGLWEQDWGGEYEYKDYDVKPNHKYWYKVQTIAWDSEEWSEESEPEVFWTLPKWKSFRVKRKGNNVSWRKMKGATGYVVTETYDKFVGYNIFGQRLYDCYRKTYFTKKNKYKIKNRNYYKNSISVSVGCYVKHDGKYYCNDGDIYSSKKHMKENSVSRHR